MGLADVIKGSAIRAVDSTAARTAWNIRNGGRIATMGEAARITGGSGGSSGMSGIMDEAAELQRAVNRPAPAAKTRPYIKGRNNAGQLGDVIPASPYSQRQAIETASHNAYIGDTIPNHMGHNELLQRDAAYAERWKKVEASRQARMTRPFGAGVAGADESYLHTQANRENLAYNAKPYMENIQKMREQGKMPWPGGGGASKQTANAAVNAAESAAKSTAGPVPNGTWKDALKASGKGIMDHFEGASLTRPIAMNAAAGALGGIAYSTAGVIDPSSFQGNGIIKPMMQGAWKGALLGATQAASGGLVKARMPGNYDAISKGARMVQKVSNSKLAQGALLMSSAGGGGESRFTRPSNPIK